MESITQVQIMDVSVSVSFYERHESICFKVDCQVSWVWLAISLVNGRLNSNPLYS